MQILENIKTVNDLSTILAEEIMKVRAGTTTAANCNAITNASGKILSTVKLQIEYGKLVGKTPHIPLIDSIIIKEEKQNKLNKGNE